MIAFKNFALRRGERLLLSKVDLTLHAGWRVGVIGRNGCGKTSLFATIMGEIESDLGNLDLPTRLRIASVAQETPSLPDPAIDFVLSGDAEVLALGASNCRIGSAKAAVFPVPVCAPAMRSRPCSTRGIACSWIGVGFS